MTDERCKHGLLLASCATCRSTAPFVSTPPRQRPGAGGSRVSEVYRQITIYYSPPPERTWGFRSAPREPLQEHRSAFQARRAINELLDGTSEVTPRRTSASQPSESRASSPRPKKPREPKAASDRFERPRGNPPKGFLTPADGEMATLLGATTQRRIEAFLPRSQRVVEIAAHQRREARWTRGLPVNFGVVPNKVPVELDGRAVYSEFAIVRRLEAAGWEAVWCKNWGGRAFWTDIGVEGPVPDPILRLFGEISVKAGGSGAWDILAWQDNRVVFIESKQYGSDKLTLNQRRWLEAALDTGVAVDAFAVYEYIA